MKNIIKITLVSLAKVGLVTIIYALFIVWMISLKTNAAEVPDQYESYQIVKEGLNKDLSELAEDEDVSYISVEFKEVPSEKVCVYNVKLTIEGEDYVMYIYLNGETDEMMGVMYDSNGDVVESTISTCTKEAEWYRE